MTDRELMQQALTALENGGRIETNEAVTALRERLAREEALDKLIADSQAMGAYSLDQIKEDLRQLDPEFDQRMERAREEHDWKSEYLKQVRLHNETLDELRSALEQNTELDKKLAREEQEPVAWIADNGTLINACTDPHLFTPLYAAPQPAREWVGLTDGVMCDIAIEHGLMSIDWIDFARAIEAKLREKNAWQA